MMKHFFTGAAVAAWPIALLGDHSNLMLAWAVTATISAVILWGRK